VAALPELALRTRLCQVGIEAEHPGEDALDVAVEDRARSPKQNAAIAAAVERPMPGRAAGPALVVGKAPPCSRATTLRAAMQVARPS
jgi:hypothetical protein